MNNREIKFRAWDNVEKRMRDYNEVSIILNSNDLKDLNSNGRKLNLNFIIQSLNIEGLKILQYTGLNDKNGKEIYEGDIIRCLAYQREMEEFTDKVLQVSYADGYFYPFGFNAGWRSGVYDIEVLGNVFENPELLK